MGIPVIIMGRSGTGKSTSIRTFKPDEIGIINVMGKPLPFRGEYKSITTQSYADVETLLRKSKVDSIVIDDAGYLITDMFMSRHSNAGTGNGVFALYNQLGDEFYKLLRFISNELPPNRIVYLFMHEDSDDFGNVKPKTIGKILDDKVCIEGLVSVLLRSAHNAQSGYVFLTNGAGIQKSPMDMFESEEIPNDLKTVDTAIRDYWDLKS